MLVTDGKCTVMVETENELRLNCEGYMRCLMEYAWWKDGVQYVGSCGTPLNQALQEAGESYEAMLADFRKKQEQTKQEPRETTRVLWWEISRGPNDASEIP